MLACLIELGLCLLQRLAAGAQFHLRHVQRQPGLVVAGLVDQAAAVQFVTACELAFLVGDIELLALDVDALLAHRRFQLRHLRLVDLFVQLQHDLAGLDPVALLHQHRAHPPDDFRRELRLLAEHEVAGSQDRGAHQTLAGDLDLHFLAAVALAAAQQQRQHDDRRDRGNADPAPVHAAARIAANAAQMP